MLYEVITPIPSLIAIFIVAMTVSTTIAFVLERVAYRPLRGAPRLIPLITAIGASFFLQYIFRGLYGSGFQAYPDIKILEGHWIIAGIRILKFQAVVIVAAVLLMFALYSFVMRTRIGKAIRSVSEDKEARITSYNVCYTKLLRGDHGGENNIELLLCLY